MIENDAAEIAVLETDSGSVGTSIVWPGSQQWAKLLRYGGVSAINVLIGQSVLFIAQTVAGWPAVASNMFSVCVSAGPAYLLSRAWVWQKRGRNDFAAEVLPFWALAVLGFLLSSLAVWWVERIWTPHPLVINATSLAAFGVVWIGRFFILDRVFRQLPKLDGLAESAETRRE